MTGPLSGLWCLGLVPGAPDFVGFDMSERDIEERAGLTVRAAGAKGGDCLIEIISLAAEKDEIEGLAQRIRRFSACLRRSGERRGLP